MKEAPLLNSDSPELKEALNEAALLNIAAKEIKEYPNDLQKGKWGGLAIRNNRKLSAEVVPSSLLFFYKVTLIVENTDDKYPLKGLVKFHLHDSFLNPDPVIAVQGGKAVLKLTKVYGIYCRSGSR